MKTFGRYLRYRIENTALRTAIFTVLAVILTMSVIPNCIDAYTEYSQTGLFMLATVLGIICTVIPMLETMGFKNRRNLDTLYFFPLKREKMALAHYLSGAIQIFFIYTVTFFASFAYLAINTDYFALFHMIPYYFLSLLLGLVMYSVFMFIFGQGNTVADGVVFSIMWMFAIALVAFAIYDAWSEYMINRDNYEVLAYYNQLPAWGIVYAPINNLTVIFQDLIEINQKSWNDGYYPDIYRSQWFMFVIWGVIGVASAIGYFITFTKKGAQKAGEISDSWFGYRLLIPVYGYSLLMLMGVEEIITIMIFVAMIVGYIIYRRSFKLKPVDLIVTACGLIPLFLRLMV